MFILIQTTQMAASHVIRSRIISRTHSKWLMMSGKEKPKHLVRFNKHIFEDIKRICDTTTPRERNLVLVHDEELPGGSSSSGNPKKAAQQQTASSNFRHGRGKKSKEPASASLNPDAATPPRDRSASRGRGGVLSDITQEVIESGAFGQEQHRSPTKSISERRDGGIELLRNSPDKALSPCLTATPQSQKSPANPSSSSAAERSSNHLGLHNPQFQCYMNASLQALAAAEPFCSYLSGATISEEESREVHSIVSVVTEIQADKPLKRKSVSAQLEFLAAMNEEQFSLPNDQQQDAHEYMTVLLGLLDTKLKALRELDLCEDLLRSTCVMLPCFCEGACQKDITPDSRELQQVILTLTVPKLRSDESTTIQEMIDQTLVTEFEERCCNTTVTAYSIFTELPRVLIVSLRRYTATGQKIKSSIEASPDLVLAEFRANEKYTKKFKSNEDSRAKSTLLGHVNKKYQLVAIVNHIGSRVKSGHYTAGVFNANEGVWIEANDERARVVEMSELICKSAKTCYLLVYVADDLDDLVKTQQRVKK